ncbi:hypothetical protein DID88_006606 [Monilinia fructigena]|uniref:Large ribosomal subunit protein mL67 n=1 Tax=Monilinia fructigena TaxID=38457 RepID=A0A395IJH7_9HELO|nr:hypothetical protein DID88_006606 [Monilinia fructigena]
MSVPSLRNCIGNPVSRTAGVRYASTTSVTARQPPNRPEHGEQIYVYNHLQTNQIVYSLTKGMNNNASLSQLPYNGKKTRPRGPPQRPLAPHGPNNLPTRQLLHGPQRLPKTPRISQTPRTLLGPRIPPLPTANTVADIAAVLKEIRHGSDRIGLQGLGKDGTVEVKWSDLSDASYAGTGPSTWGDAVIHDTLPWDRNNRSILKKQALSAEKQAEWQAARAAQKAANEEKKQKNREQNERNMRAREERWAKHVALMEKHRAMGKGPKVLPVRIRQSPEENWALERQARVEKLAWMERTGGSEQDYEWSRQQAEEADVVKTQESALENEAQAQAQAAVGAEAEADAPTPAPTPNPI